MTGSLSNETLKLPVSSNSVDNLPYTSPDVSNTWQILGPSIEELRGKTVRRNPERVKEQTVMIPMEVAEQIKTLTLKADVFFVDRIPFLITMSRGLQFVTAEYTPSQKARDLADHLKKVLRVYHRAFFWSDMCSWMANLKK